MTVKPTLIGHVDSVKGSVITVRLRDDIPTFLMLEGKSYRIGQIGAFLRVPLGYTQLYAVCTLVGAAAAPKAIDLSLAGQRWLSATLFGESIGGVFERGVGQYPTIGDEVHLVTPSDMRIIYGSTQQERLITVGRIASASGMLGGLDLGRLVARHCAVVGSTGSGKSNLVSVLVEAIASQDLPAARVLIIDPHGEYASAVGEHGYVFRVNANAEADEHNLYVPYWALPFDELQAVALGGVQPHVETAIRDEVTKLRQSAAALLTHPPSAAAITADSPVPFSIKKLWFDLDEYERRTFADAERTTPAEPLVKGDPETLTPRQYPAASAGLKAPFTHQRARNIGRQLEHMRSRLRDSRFAFLFAPGPDYTPDAEGKVREDLHHLVRSWVGHDRTVTILDVSGLPSELLATIVGTMVRIIYNTLFWAMDLPVSGRHQPLLIVLDEAHIFLPEGGNSAAHRSITQIAKEGRKYGVGLCVVTQRPVEIDGTVLSQCGTMISLRLSNPADRHKVEAAMPDDLGGLAGMLPALRTGEGIIVGEAMPIPSRIQFFRVRNRPRGDDPIMPGAWRRARPDPKHYEAAVRNWREQRVVARGGADDA